MAKMRARDRAGQIRDGHGWKKGRLGLAMVGTDERRGRVIIALSLIQ